MQNQNPVIDIQTFITKYKCTSKLEDRICSRCKRSGFTVTPAFYKFDNFNSIYLCDFCNANCSKPYSGVWYGNATVFAPTVSIYGVEIVSSEIENMVRDELEKYYFP
jgi:hypothetical protein